MRAAKIILKIVFALLLVASITLNVILGCSSTNKLIFGDSLEARISLYHNAKRQLESEETSKNYTLRAEVVTKLTDDSTKKETSTISCETVEEVKKCVAIMQHNIDSEVVKTRYLPGNGKEYFIEGKEKYFVENNFIHLPESPSSIENFDLLSFIQTDVEDFDKEQKELVKDEKLRQHISIKSKVNFDFHTLSLVKEVTVTMIIPTLDAETKEITDYTCIIKFKFDGYDRLIELLCEDDYVNPSLTLKISYESTKLTFPDFKDFVAKEAE